MPDGEQGRDAHLRDIWNKEMDARRNEETDTLGFTGIGKKKSLGKGDFDPEAGPTSELQKKLDMHIPLDVYRHEAVQAAEEFFVEKRDEGGETKETGLSKEQLGRLNDIQNRMREELSRFPAMRQARAYETNEPMSQYAEQARSSPVNPEESLAWNVVAIAAKKYLDRAKEV